MNETNSLRKAADKWALTFSVIHAVLQTRCKGRSREETLYPECGMMGILWVQLCPLKSYVEILFLSISDCELTWK